MTSRGLTLEQEQAAFEAQLDDLLKEHAGQFALFKDGRPVDFFEDHSKAYEAGLDRFGIDDVFLVGQVLKSRPEPVSFAWAAGVMFGK